MWNTILSIACLLLLSSAETGWAQASFAASESPFGAAVSPSGSVMRAMPRDTVFVTPSMTTYLIFPANIEVLDIGSRDYTGKIESGNMLFLKPLKAQPAPSSLLVRTAGEGLYLSYLLYSKQPRRVFYDYRQDHAQTVSGRKPTGKGQMQASQEQEKAALDKETVRQRLIGLQKQPKERLTKARSYRLKLTVTHLAVDSATLYLGFALLNRSALPYELGHVSFSYREPRPRKSRRRVHPEERPSTPVASVATGKVKPYSVGSFLYALPLHAGSRRSYLEVVFREKGSSRTLFCKVMAGRLSRAASIDSLKSTSP